MNRRWTRLLVIAASIAGSIVIVVGLRISLAAEPDDSGPPDGPPARRPASAPDQGEAKKFTGSIAQFNYTPRGERDGILLTADGKLVQLNFPPFEAEKLGDAVAVGDSITAEGHAEPVRADHTVARLEKLTTAKGKEIELGGPPRPRGEAEPGQGPDQRSGERPRQRSASNPSNGSDQAGPPRRERAAPKTETVKGVVKSLNRGGRGEVDGALLESGDFIRIGAREAEEIKLAVGQEISVEGYAVKMPDGHTMISFPTKINDKEIERGQAIGRRGGGERQPSSRDDAPRRDNPPPPEN